MKVAGALLAAALLLCAGCASDGGAIGGAQYAPSMIQRIPRCPGRQEIPGHSCRQSVSRDASRRDSTSPVAGHAGQQAADQFHLHLRKARREAASGLSALPRVQCRQRPRLKPGLRGAKPFQARHPPAVSMCSASIAATTSRVETRPGRRRPDSKRLSPSQTRFEPRSLAALNTR